MLQLFVILIVVAIVLACILFCLNASYKGSVSQADASSAAAAGNDRCTPATMREVESIVTNVTQAIADESTDKLYQRLNTEMQEFAKATAAAAASNSGSSSSSSSSRETTIEKVCLDACQIIRKLYPKNTIIESYDTYEQIYGQYNLDMSNGTGLYDKWHEDTSVLSDMSLCLANLCIEAQHDAKGSSSQTIAICLSENFLQRFHQQLVSRGKFNDNDKLKTPPWGTNWYPFTINVSFWLASFILLQIPKITDFTLLASKLILNIISSPRQAFGYKRSNNDALVMCSAWLLARLQQQQQQQRHQLKLNSKDFDELLYCWRVSQARKTRLYGEEGLHIDYAPLLRLNDGYSIPNLEILSSLLQLKMCYFYALVSISVGKDDDPFDGKAIFNDIVHSLDTVKSIIYHPTILRNSAPFYKMTTLQTAAINECSTVECEAAAAAAAAALGTKVIPSISYIRYFHKDYIFSMRAQCPKIATCRVQQEKSVKNFIDFQYYTFFRGVLHGESSQEFTPKDFGFIDSSDTALVATTFVDSCTKSSSIIPDETATMSFVCSWNNDYGLLYQTLKFSFMPGLRIEEFVFCDGTKEQIHCVVRLEKEGKMDDNDEVKFNYTYTACPLDQLTPLETYRNHLETVVCDKTSTIYTCFDLAKNTVLSTRVDEPHLPLLSSSSSSTIDSNIPEFSTFITSKIIPEKMSIDLEKVLGFMIIKISTSQGETSPITSTIVAAPINDKLSIHTCRSNKITLDSIHTLAFDEQSNQYILA